MPLFDLLAGALFIGIWTGLGVVAWLVSSVLTRGHAGMMMLLLCALAGAAGGMLVPFLGFTNVTGIWLSFVVALALPACLMLARRFASPAPVLDTGYSEAARSTEPK